MWLKQNHDSPATRTEFCGSERGSDLRRMMSVVIDDQHTVNFALRLKPAARTGETVQPFNDLFERDFQLKPDRYRRECVVDVVHARHAQDHLAHHVCSTPNCERRSEVVVVTNSVSGDVRLRATAVSQATPFKER